MYILWDIDIKIYDVRNLFEVMVMKFFFFLDVFCIFNVYYMYVYIRIYIEISIYVDINF